MPKTSTKITAADRVRDFGRDIFSSDGGLLFCKLCNKAVDYVRRDSIVDHIKSKRHRDRAEYHEKNEGPPAKKATTIEGCFVRAAGASEVKEELCMDLVGAFAAADIPLEKVDNPSIRRFFEKHVKSGGSIPHYHSQRLFE